MNSVVYSFTFSPVLLFRDFAVFLALTGWDLPYILKFFLSSSLLPERTETISLSVSNLFAITVCSSYEFIEFIEYKQTLDSLGI